MWPFKRKSKSDAVIEIIPKVAERAAERWRYFCDSIPFNDEVPLRERIHAFAIPAFKGIEEIFPPMRGAPDGLKMIAIAKGIVLSGTHTKEEVEAAMQAEIPIFPGEEGSAK